MQRAKHILELHGVDVAFETNTAMPKDFLMQQMELRERLEEAKDAPALDALRADLLDSRRSFEAQIAEALDRRKDYSNGASLVRKLQFLHRLDDEIDAAYDSLE